MIRTTELSWPQKLKNLRIKLFLINQGPCLLNSSFQANTPLFVGKTCTEKLPYACMATKYEKFKI